MWHIVPKVRSRMSLAAEVGEKEAERGTQSMWMQGIPNRGGSWSTC